MTQKETDFSSFSENVSSKSTKRDSDSVAKVKCKISCNPAAPKAKRWITLMCERSSSRAELGLFS